MFLIALLLYAILSLTSGFQDKDITYYIHSKALPDGIPIKYNEILSKDIHFNSSKSTVVIIHGWWDSHTSEMDTMLVDAFRDNYDVNLIVVDWSVISGGLYGIAKDNVPFTGQSVYKFLNNLTTIYKVAPADISIVGHSLGSHVAGIVGKHFNGEISFIVGLEPAAPFIDTSDKTYCVNKGDAKFVQVIHTTGGKLGIKQALGDVDFYPNGGQEQPGCFFDIFGNCGHKRAYKLYEESIRENRFISRQCDDYKTFKSGKCEGPFALMGGYPVNTTITGIYYLDTNSNPPYGKGDV